MRIVAGRHRGRNLSVPSGATTRPTSDRARQALFNVLEHGRLGSSGSPIVAARVLDGFAGTGALGLEALSRGAVHASFFEQDRAAALCVRDNIASLGETDRATVILGDIRRPPKAEIPCSLAFLDPPYGAGLIAPAIEALCLGGWLESGCLVVAEIGASDSIIVPEGFTVLDQRIYGAAKLLFLRGP